MKAFQVDIVITDEHDNRDETEIMDMLIDCMADNDMTFAGGIKEIDPDTGEDK